MSEPTVNPPGQPGSDAASTAAPPPDQSAPTSQGAWKPFGQAPVTAPPVTAATAASTELAPTPAPAPKSVPLALAIERGRSYVKGLTEPVEVENQEVSPAPYAAQAPGWVQDRTVLEYKLGRRLDGWADTVPGMAAHAPLLIQEFVNDMPSHLNPRIWPVSTRLAVTGLNSLAQGVEIPVSPRGLLRIFSLIGPAFGIVPRIILRLLGLDIIGRERDYLFVATTAGAAVGVNISANGRDLYLAWDLFLRRVWNELTLGLVALIGIVVGAIAGLLTTHIAKLSGITTLPLTLAFVGAFLVAGLIGVVACCILGALFGSVTVGDPQALFVKQIDFFEAHDVQAMALSVDKALRAAADKAGINAALLRAKGEFRTGRRGRVI